MRIVNLRSQKVETRSRVLAEVVWEDCDRPTHELYFETAEEFSQSLSCNPHAFLVACAIPAMHYGEKRVFIDAEICPELREGLSVALGWLRHWFQPDREPLRIEAKTRSSIPKLRGPERSGFLFSGGIDSLATLRANRLNFPEEHPLSIKDGLLVYGLEMDDPKAFEYVVNSLSDLAQKINIKLIPVYTNQYLDYRDEDSAAGFTFWWERYEGAALAAVAHAFARRFTVVSIASDYDISNLRPFGSHPLLVTNYSSAELRILLFGSHLSRFARTKMVADWGVPLKHIRVCNQYKLYRPGELNCGECDKCIRTMLALLALGVLDQASAFHENDLSPELLHRGIKLGPIATPFYKELIAPLAARGRHDLIDAINDKIAEYHKAQKRKRWKEEIKRFDQKYLKGKLIKLKRSMRS
jgi:hypothetical protein